MSRVRFHSIDAISKVAKVTYSGNGWDNYDSSKPVQVNINRIYRGANPDLIVVYKPLELRQIHLSPIPKCITYNEMWDIDGTMNEIIESGAKLVIAHHANDLPKYHHLHSQVCFVNISHCAEQTIYRDYGEEKKYDVLLVGALNPKYYPFRCRLANLIRTKMDSKIRCKILEHPGPNLLHSHGAILEEYAKEINRAKITLTCSSKYRYRLGKYVEIPMCASILGGDLPDENQQFFRQFMLVLDPMESDDEIIRHIMEYVQNDDIRLQKIKHGLDLARNYTQECYASRFLNSASHFLKNRSYR
jgi:hypothetical protein